MFGIESTLNSKIYVGDNSKPLQLKEYKDMIPYFPHIITASSYNKEQNSSVIHLTSESWVDIEERKMLKFYMEEVLKYYRSCKRNKKPFEAEEAIKKFGWMFDKTAANMIIERVQQQGQRASIEGLHLPYYEHCREELERYKQFIELQNDLINDLMNEDKK